MLIRPFFYFFLLSSYKYFRAQRAGRNQLEKLFRISQQPPHQNHPALHADEKKGPLLGQGVCGTIIRRTLLASLVVKSRQARVTPSSSLPTDASRTSKIQTMAAQSPNGNHSYYLKRATKEISVDLTKLREAPDFKSDSVTLLIHAISQGSASLSSKTPSKDRNRLFLGSNATSTPYNTKA